LGGLALPDIKYSEEGGEMFKKIFLFIMLMIWVKSFLFAQRLGEDYIVHNLHNPYILFLIVSTIILIIVLTFRLISYISKWSGRPVLKMLEPIMVNPTLNDLKNKKKPVDILLTLNRERKTVRCIVAENPRGNDLPPVVYFEGSNHPVSWEKRKLGAAQTLPKSSKTF